jgi:hypothetical protein
MKIDQTLTLPSGVEISFRVVRPDDAPALQRIHAIDAANAPSTCASSVR